MEIILPSFGLSHLRRRYKVNRDIFYRMPPVALSNLGSGFIPDYAVLLLCDQIILDEETFSRFVEESTYIGYRDVARTLLTLYKEGFVKIEDFGAIIDKNHSYLESMLENDLIDLDYWITPYKESYRLWMEFVDSMKMYLYNDSANSDHKFAMGENDILKKRMSRYSIGEYIHISYARVVAGKARIQMYEELVNSNLKNGDLSEKSIECFQQLLAEYLSYVNANLVLSKSLNASFHDWFDFAPFYNRKINLLGKNQTLGRERVNHIKQLFSVTFPDLSLWEDKKLIKALHDKRIGDLRSLVDKAIRGEVDFDQRFANNILREVLRIEHNIKNKRNLISYITLPYP